MYVDTSSSGKGLGKLMINEVISRVKKVPDIEQINLTVVEHNIMLSGFTTLSDLKYLLGKGMQMSLLLKSDIK